MIFTSEPVTCNGKHTRYQPTEEEWACPFCGAKDDKFYIDNQTDDAAGDCIRLHDQDYIICESCGRDITGKKFADILRRKHNLIPCEHCRGTGLRPKEGKK